MMESAYSSPYTGKQGTCTAEPRKGRGKIDGYTWIDTGSVAALKTGIARGPTSVSVNGSSAYFSQYREGVINSEYCSTRPNHAVTAVGYTSEYYIIKNSWNTWWGENGYAKIAIIGDGEGICGIQNSSNAPYIL